MPWWCCKEGHRVSLPIIFLCCACNFLNVFFCLVYQFHLYAEHIPHLTHIHLVILIFATFVCITTILFIYIYKTPVTPSGICFISLMLSCSFVLILTCVSLPETQMGTLTGLFTLTLLSSLDLDPTPWTATAVCGETESTWYVGHYMACCTNPGW
jgi:hypothetical protein